MQSEPPQGAGGAWGSGGGAAIHTKFQTSRRALRERRAARGALREIGNFVWIAASTPSPCSARPLRGLAPHVSERGKFSAAIHTKFPISRSALRATRSARREVGNCVWIAANTLIHVPLAPLRGLVPRSTRTISNFAQRAARASRSAQRAARNWNFCADRCRNPFSMLRSAPAGARSACFRTTRWIYDDLDL